MAKKANAAAAPKSDADGSTTAASLFERLYTDAFPYHQRARDCAAVTIPYLFPPQGTSGATTLPTPWQSLGAEALNNLASKLLLALLPPNTPFFRLSMADFVKNQAAQDPNMKPQIEAGLSAIERAIMAEIEDTSVRTTLFEAIKHLICSGNGCVFLPSAGGMKFFRMTHYGVQRDSMGDVVRAVIKEEVLVSTLSPEVQALAKLGGIDVEANTDGDADDEVAVYTRIELVGGKVYNIRQELQNGQIVPGSLGSYPKDKTPYLFLRWMKMDSEHYGRGHVEEYLGDFQSLDGLSKSIIEGAAIAAKVVMLVDPNGTTQAEDINRAENGDAVPGRKDEVIVFQADKFADFRVALEAIGTIEKRLARAFMLTASIQRDAERVTAEEIRLMATELETSIGGVYSILSQEFQLPFLRRIMSRMQAAGKLPKLPTGTVTPTIVTGLEALGRGAELNKLVTFTRVLQETLGPQAVAQILQLSPFATQVGSLLGLDTSGIVKTDAQMQQEAAMAQKQQTIQALGPEAMRAAAAGQQQG